MTRKHYIMLATAIKLCTDSQDPDYLHKGKFLIELVTVLHKDNPNFSIHRFIEACTK